MSPARDARIDRLLQAGPAVDAFIGLPRDTFLMGGTGRKDELPIHPVTLDAFAVAITPVSNAEYGRFLAATGHDPSRFWHDPHFTEPDRPVVGVNWFDAVDYCEWLSSVLDVRCRLPTEAEREYAALGGVSDGRAYPWGDEPWSGGEFAFGAAGMDRPIPLGSTPPNAYGLYHVAENVHEWCSDWYDPAGYPPDPAENPTGPSAGERRASRGGSWRHRVKVSRIASRSSLAPERRYNDYGFRVYADVQAAAR